MFLNIFSVLVDSDMSVLFVNNGDQEQQYAMCTFENCKVIKMVARTRNSQKSSTPKVVFRPLKARKNIHCEQGKA